jgi:hypothetical protein
VAVALQLKRLHLQNRLPPHPKNRLPPQNLLRLKNR